MKARNETFKSLVAQKPCLAKKSTQTVHSPQASYSPRRSRVLRLGVGDTNLLACQGFLFWWFSMLYWSGRANRAGRMFLAVQGMRRVVG